VDDNSSWPRNVKSTPRRFAETEKPKLEMVVGKVDDSATSFPSVYGKLMVRKSLDSCCFSCYVSERVGSSITNLPIMKTVVNACSHG